MYRFTPKETDFIGIIKKQIEKFIKDSNVIDGNAKRELIEELGGNFYDDRFDATKFITDAVGLAIYRWNEQNFKLVELWKEIAINNAKSNNKPYEVADSTIASFKDSFMNLDPTDT